MRSFLKTVCYVIARGVGLPSSRVVGYLQASTSLDKAACSSNVNSVVIHESTETSIPQHVNEVDGQQCQDDVKTEKLATGHR